MSPQSVPAAKPALLGTACPILGEAGRLQIDHISQHTVQFIGPLFHSKTSGTSLVVQWLRLHLPMQGGEGVILDGDAKIPYDSESKSQDTKQKQYYNKFTKG